MRKGIYMFVYGTLRRGFEGNRLLVDSRFLGMAKTKEKYRMFAEDVPYVYKEKKTTVIVGEVYEIDGPTLEILDNFEGHPDCYRRELVDIVLDAGSQIQAWIYFNPEPAGAVVQSGDFLNWTMNFDLMKSKEIS